MVYETRNHWFIKDNEKIELTNLEHKLLMLLAKNFNKLVTYKEIAESIYNSDVRYVMNSIRAIKRRLKEKISSVDSASMHQVDVAMMISLGIINQQV